MEQIKFKGFIAIIAGVSLGLQILILWRSECHLSNRRSQYSVSAVVDRKVSRRVLFSQANNTSPTTLHDHDEGRGFPKEVRDKRYLTIGIPTIRRKDDTYVFDMLHSMLNKTSADDLKKVVFVLFLADLNETEWKRSAEEKIKSNHKSYIKNGSLIVIQAPASFYSEMETDDSSYLKWRRKQNYDYAYLMKYSKHLSEYYMQMEDDVIASDGYLSAIKTYIDEQKDDAWTCLEFSELGFIGKLYHSRHINSLADMLLMFSHTQPVDYTFLYFNILMGQGYRAIRKPTLFQHMGYHSSLPEKIQQLKDRYYDFKDKTIIGDNPDATLKTTLKTVPEFPPELAYSKEPGYFWSAAAARENDTFTIIFKDAQVVTSCIIQTGSKDHPGDLVENGILEASPTLSENKESCLDYVVLTKFEKGNVNATDIKSKMGLFKIKCLQIRLTKSQIPWIIIRELAVFIKN